MINLHENEIVLAVIRKHWVIFVFEVSVVLALVFLPLVIVPFLYLVDLPPEVVANFAEVVGLFMYFYFLWLIAIAHIVTVIWTDYFLDIWVVTNQRIIDLEQLGLFHRRISSCRLDLIQDVTISIPGVFATFVKYGNIHVQTAGQAGAFTMVGVDDPQLLKELIISEHHRAMEKVREVRVTDDD